MVDDRSQLGFLTAALGAAVLAVSVFLPWYGVSITASGAATAQQQLATVAQQYGNTTFQAGADQLGAEFSSLAGRQLTTVSGHEAVKHISLMLLLLAGISLVASLLRLAGIPGLIEASGSQIAVSRKLTCVHNQGVARSGDADKLRKCRQISSSPASRRAARCCRRGRA